MEEIKYISCELPESIKRHLEIINNIYNSEIINLGIPKERMGNIQTNRNIITYNKHAKN
jgi:hypothetical protein